MHTTGSSPRTTKLLTTPGCILADGSVLELVGNPYDLHLLHYDGSRFVEGPVFERDGIIYAPPRLDSSLCQAIRFPSAPGEYDSPGALFSRIQDLFRRYGFDGEIAGWGALFGLSSWAPELFYQLPTLVLWGKDVHSVGPFFLLLTAVCRRALMCTRLSQSLPFHLNPTLLAVANRMSLAQWEAWRASNLRGSWTSFKAGKMEKISGPRALFVTEPIECWAENEWRVSLIGPPEVLPPTEIELAGIAKEFQSSLLTFRLRQLVKGSVTPDKAPARFGASSTRQLFRFLDGEDGIFDAVAPLLERQERDFAESQLRDPHRGLVECLWSPCHGEQEISVAKLAERLNALLRSRGEVMVYEPSDLGWTLRRLGIERKRNQSGMVVRFSADLRLQVHDLARKFGLDLPTIETCADCQRTKDAV